MSARLHTTRLATAAIVVLLATGAAHAQKNGSKSSTSGRPPIPPPSVTPKPGAVSRTPATGPLPAAPGVNPAPSGNLPKRTIVAGDKIPTTVPDFPGGVRKPVELPGLNKIEQKPRFPKTIPLPHEKLPDIKKIPRLPTGTGETTPRHDPLPIPAPTHKNTGRPRWPVVISSPPLVVVPATSVVIGPVGRPTMVGSSSPRPTEQLSRRKIFAGSQRNRSGAASLPGLPR